MCGIVGIGGFRNDNLIRQMNDLIQHRGPDDEGYFFSHNHSLGMRRLSIIDLATGKQPMSASEGKVTIVFNGEIYNYNELKIILQEKGHTFKSTSDTETILIGYLEWGLDFVKKLNGMFSIAISDLRNKPKLYLIRDRVGVKPLYYHFSNGEITFGSELKAILSNQNIRKDIDPWAVHNYLRLRYVPGDECLIKNVFKLPPGSILKFEDKQISINKYWAPNFPVEKSKLNRHDLIDGLKEKIEKSIERRLVSDVPVGAYLSAGIDSSIIVAIMAKYHNEKINTFTVGFNDNNNETNYAAKTAKILGVNHYPISCNDSDFSELEKIVWHLDEPIGDAIVLPMYLLAKEARKHVKVVLSGEGADEVFGGYLFHKTLNAASYYKSKFPKKIRRILRSLFDIVPHNVINYAFSYPANLGESGKDKLSSYLKNIDDYNILEQYRTLISLYEEPKLYESYNKDFLSSLHKSNNYLSDIPINGSNSQLDVILAAQYRDWLPDDILMKLDKMTMAHSLEGREPFLDHELIDYVNCLPDSFKIKGWKDKYILREYAKDILPSENSNRKKLPFYIPIDQYFKKPTFKKLFDQFKEENYLAQIFDQKTLSNLSTEKTDLIESKQLFSLVILNLWFKKVFN